MIGPAGAGNPTPSSDGNRSGRRRTSVRIPPPPSWSRPSTGDWATTQSVTSSTPCCATTPCSSTSLGLYRWTTPEPRLLFRFVAAADETQVARDRLPGRSSPGPVLARAHHCRQHARPAPAPLPHRSHRRRRLPHEAGQSEVRNPSRDQVNLSEEWLRSRDRGRDAPAPRPARPCGSSDGPSPSGGRVAVLAPLPVARILARVRVLHA